MRILLHCCCGPCTLYPLEILRNAGHEVHGYFYNPNIHPYREFIKRRTSFRELNTLKKLSLSYEDYNLNDYLRSIVHNEQSRCRICYDLRLEKTVAFAKSQDFEAFSTTLLYSKYQKHQQIIDSATALADRYEIQFYYEDFREGWQQGIDESISLDLYRQPYCGCIYSEQERYDKKLRRKK